MTPRHILIVEDEIHACFTMTLILRKYGFHVTSTKEGKTAFKMIMERKESPEPVDLLIADIQMSGLDGIDLVEEMEKAQILVPVIIITGWGHEEKVMKLMRKENIAFIEKPFVPQDLIERVKKSIAEDRGSVANMVCS